MWVIEEYEGLIYVRWHMSGGVVWVFPSNAYGQRCAETMVEWKNQIFAAAWLAA